MSELLILIFAALLLIGSISIAIPSKASREISKLRMSAKLLGCNITSTLYGKNIFKNESSINVSYQIKNVSNLKEGHFIRDKKEFILYSPLKLKYEDNFLELISKLNNISEDVIEVAFIGSQISFLWKEKTDITELKKISTELNHI